MLCRNKSLQLPLSYNSRQATIHQRYKNKNTTMPKRKRNTTKSNNITRNIAKQRAQQEAEKREQLRKIFYDDFLKSTFLDTPTKRRKMILEKHYVPKYYKAVADAHMGVSELGTLATRQLKKHHFIDGSRPRIVFTKDKSGNYLEEVAYEKVYDKLVDGCIEKDHQSTHLTKFVRDNYSNITKEMVAWFCRQHCPGCSKKRKDWKQKTIKDNHDNDDNHHNDDNHQKQQVDFNKQKTKGLEEWMKFRDDVSLQSRFTGLSDTNSLAPPTSPPPTTSPTNVDYMENRTTTLVDAQTNTLTLSPTIKEYYRTILQARKRFQLTRDCPVMVDQKCFSGGITEIGIDRIVKLLIARNSNPSQPQPHGYPNISQQIRAMCATNSILVYLQKSFSHNHWKNIVGRVKDVNFFNSDDEIFLGLLMNFFLFEASTSNKLIEECHLTINPFSNGCIVPTQTAPRKKTYQVSPHEIAGFVGILIGGESNEDNYQDVTEVFNQMVGKLSSLQIPELSTTWKYQTCNNYRCLGCGKNWRHEVSNDTIAIELSKEYFFDNKSILYGNSGNPPYEIIEASVIHIEEYELEGISYFYKIKLDDIEKIITDGNYNTQGRASGVHQCECPPNCVFQQSDGFQVIPHETKRFCISFTRIIPGDPDNDLLKAIKEQINRDLNAMEENDLRSKFSNDFWVDGIFGSKDHRLDLPIPGANNEVCSYVIDCVVMRMVGRGGGDGHYATAIKVGDDWYFVNDDHTKKIIIDTKNGNGSPIKFYKSGIRKNEMYSFHLIFYKLIEDT